MMTQELDRLILLVGANPLPNAIVAQRLLNNGKTVILLYTESTAPVAERLIAFFKTKGLRTESIEVDRISTFEVFHKLQEYLSNVNKQEHIGLNYTGGTKSMAVHAWRACQEACNILGLQLTTSYLDAKTMSIHIDQLNPVDSGDFRPIDTRVNPKVTLKEMVELHGWQLNPRKPAPATSASFRRQSKLIGQVCSQASTFDKWQQWRAVLLDTYISNKTAHPDDKEQHYKFLPPTLPEGKAFNGLRDLLERNETIVEITKRLAPDTLPSSFLNWINGGWLEAMALDALLTLKDELNLVFAASNVYMEAQDAYPASTRPNFEFDLAAIRGNRLFAVSCNITDKRDTQKQKLFEIGTRARQMGGDQARIGLISLNSNPERLQEELREVLRDDRVKVWGAKHARFDVLKQELSEWITS